MSAIVRDEPTAVDKFWPFGDPFLTGIGGWMPESRHILDNWVDKQLEAVKDEPERDQHSVIKEFRDLIETNPEVYMGFHRIFDDLPPVEASEKRSQVKDYDTMLLLFDRNLTQAPEFDADFLVFLPFTAILQWPMSMSNGLTILINREVNHQFHRLFEVWSQHLGSLASRNVITEKGWLSKEALARMPGFIETFVCDPKKPHWGFRSWDDFFARRLRDGARPVEDPGNSSIIVSACESIPLRITDNIRERDQFWIKGQPYSVTHMLNNHPEAKQFIGGTVYQAFLSPFFYHRWSSPVDGTIELIDVVQGTYFAGMPSSTLPSPDAYALQGQQPFLAHVATRALIFIRSKDPRIGLMCFIAVGMVEVSSCEVTVRKDQVVKKGDEIGTFHFGGSTHCLVFGPQTRLKFHVKIGKQAELAPVHSHIAEVL